MIKKLTLLMVPFILLTTSCGKPNYGYKYPKPDHLPLGEHFVYWLEVEDYIKEDTTPYYKDTGSQYDNTRFKDYSVYIKLDKRAPLNTLGKFFQAIEDEGFKRKYTDERSQKYYDASNWKSAKQVVKDEYSAKWEIKSDTWRGSTETTRLITIVVSYYYDDKFDEKDYGLKISYVDTMTIHKEG